MTQTEVLRLALEALENWLEFDPENFGEVDKKAITAIKAALEAKDEPVAVYGYCPVCGAKGTSRERHPDGNTTCVNGHKYKSRDTLSTPPHQEAKDEPVAWMSEEDDCIFLDKDKPNPMDYDFWTPLYTTPPQRTWVGLTDAEYKELHLQMGPVYYYQDYGHAIETKLKEKNT